MLLLVPHNYEVHELGLWEYRKLLRVFMLKNDKSFMVSDIICLQETGITTERQELERYTCYNSGGGKNKGVAIYLKEGMKKDIKEPPQKIVNKICQGLKLSFGAFDLITVYLANGQSSSSIKK